MTTVHIEDLTYMCIEYLDLAKKRMKNDNTGCCFAYEPVSSSNVERCAIERVRVY